MDKFCILIIGNVNYFLKTLINKAFSFLEGIQLSLYVDYVLLANCHRN